MIFKNPKGTRDFIGIEYEKYVYISHIIEKRFRQFGGTGMKTPIFELKDILMKKYGDEADKEIFSVEFSINKNKKNISEGKQNQNEEPKELNENETNDQNNKEQLALRYDQTVPLVRYLIQNGIKKMRRYQIGTVYRIDTPNLKQNRLREFTQADFDFVGEDAYEPELDMLKMINLVMTDLGIENYHIQYNFRQNLYSMFRTCGIDNNEEQLLYMSSVLDRLDKIGWDGIGEILGEELTQKLQKIIDSKFVDEGFISDLNIFQKLLFWYDIKNCEFKPSLARGLDYYTGFIFEVFIDGFPNAVAGGGRYDNLIATMKDAKVVKNSPKLAGFSLGIERLLPFVKYSDQEESSKTKFYIISLGKKEELCKTKMEIINIIRFYYPNVQIGYMIKDRKLGKQIRTCLEEGYDYMILLGENEFDQGNCKIKDLKNETEMVVSISDLNTFFNKN